MPVSNSNSRMVGIRLQNATYAEIERLLKVSIKQQADSVTIYCQNVIERYVWRHSTRKFRKKPE